MKNKRLLRFLGGLFFFIFCLVCVLWLSGAGFMLAHHLDPTLSRPWSIILYAQMYWHGPSPALAKSVRLWLFLPPLACLLIVLFIAVTKPQRPLHGDARWANGSEIQKAGLLSRKTEKTILLGKRGGHYLTFPGYQFVLLAAPTRSGKGVGIVIPNCLTYSDSLVVLDIKLENFDLTAGYRKNVLKQDVYLFAPFDDKGRTHCYNPLEYISSAPQQRIGDIDAIAAALYSSTGSQDKFWAEQAKDLFRGLCLLVLETPKIPHTLGEILRQASGKGKPLKEHIKDMMEEAKADNRGYSAACIDALTRILSNSENTLSGIVATFTTPLLIFQNSQVDTAMSRNSFDLREVRKKKMTIYLGIRPDKLNQAAVIVNLFFDQLLNLNTRELPSQNKELKYQCLLIMDEFTSIGKVAMVNKAVSYMAGYNMRLLTIIQNKSQLEEVYGKSGALTIMANHAAQVLYAPSPVVMSDAKEYSEMLGDMTVKSKSRSRASAMALNNKGNSGSVSESDQRRALMLPQEIRMLGKDREIVNLENVRPILCEKIRYYLDPYFTKRANLPIDPHLVPIQDAAAYLARVEQRTRPLQLSDLQNPQAADSISGGDISTDSILSMIDEVENNLDVPAKPDEDPQEYEQRAETEKKQAGANVWLDTFFQSQKRSNVQPLQQGVSTEQTEAAAAKLFGDDDADSEENEDDIDEGVSSDTEDLDEEEADSSDAGSDPQRK